jgi:hypothetical protein
MHDLAAVNANAELQVVLPTFSRAKLKLKFFPELR